MPLGVRHFGNRGYLLTGPGVIDQNIESVESGKEIIYRRAIDYIQLGSTRLKPICAHYCTLRLGLVQLQIGNHHLCSARTEFPRNPQPQPLCRTGDYSLQAC